MEKTFMLACKPSDTISDVWEDIRKRSHDPTDGLFFHLKPVMKGMFVLVCRNEPLKASSTLSECRITDESRLELLGTEPVPISVSVAENGACFDLDVNCFLTIHNLKTMLYSLTQVPPSSQCLTYQNYSLNEDKRLLQDYGILPPFEYDDESNCRKRLSQKGRKKKFEIQLRTVEPSDDDVTGDCSPQLHHSRVYDFDDSALQVFVDIPTIPFRSPLGFRPTDTIGHARQVIQGKIKKGLFVLFSDSKQLEDDSITLHECGIKNMDSIQVLEKETFEIAISAPEEGPDIIRVRVACFDTIGCLKAKLQVRAGIPRERQRLVVHDWFLDDDERFLVDYGIATDSLVLVNRPKEHPRSENDRRKELLIFLFASSVGPESGRSSATKAGLSSQELRKCVLYCSLPQNPRPCGPYASEMASLAALSITPSSGEDYSTVLLQIAIEIPNMLWRFPLVCKPTDEVGSVRQAVRRECYKQCKELLGQKYIEEGRFVLAFERKQLLNESLTLDECGIGHMDAIELLEDEYFLIEINVLEKGVHTCVRVKCFDTIRKLKEDIFDMTGIPPSQLQAHLAVDHFWWWLEDDGVGTRRLVDYGITREVRYDEDVCVERETENRRPIERILELHAYSSRHFFDGFS